VRRPDAGRPEAPSPGVSLGMGEVGLPSRADRSLMWLSRALVHLRPQPRCGTETMDVGMDCVSAVCDEYGDRTPFPFTGTIASVNLDLPAVPQPTGMKRLELATKMD
jgi:hypothetical protein